MSDALGRAQNLEPGMKRSGEAPQIPLVARVGKHLLSVQKTQQARLGR